jgi:hypothetical protein
VAKEKLFIHSKLMQLLSRDSNEFAPYASQAYRLTQRGLLTASSKLSRRQSDAMKASFPDWQKHPGWTKSALAASVSI